MAKRKTDSRVAMLADAAVPVATVAVQPPQPQKDRLRGRLPDKTCILLAYNATTATWDGSMQAAGDVVTAKESSLSKTLGTLLGHYDDYRPSVLAK